MSAATTIRSEGGLLPRDVLARIADLDSGLGGLTPDAYHLARGERIGEAIARSWSRLTGAWEILATERDQLPAGDQAGKLTRERWQLPLLAELGYGRIVQHAAVDLDGRSYPVFAEYQHSPIHLVGAGVPLDRRTAGVRGAAEQSPHSLVQELLNRSSERLWGIVTNGLSLRLLRDNVTLTRQAYVEFDLESIMASEAYEDFALLWLCCHQSRVEAERPEECWLEHWTQAAERDGARALGDLRVGVERAIEVLGRGFLAQPANEQLHSDLGSGALDGQGYYRELLRIIYRLLFLFVAEDRDVLLLPEDGTVERREARRRFDAYYGTARLRRLAGRRRGGRAYDIYELVKLLTDWLHDGGQAGLALPALGSALWDPQTTPHLRDARLGNEALLEAIRELAFVDGTRRPVDFRHLGTEELGSVYESLLELHPVIDRHVSGFALESAAGHDRKKTGSYYTPTSLISSLLETALDPVIDRAAAQPDPEQALLDLTVCDPACGSGHFLIAAANRIAKSLAAVREHDPEPAPEAVQTALRDVVARCIHGVDVNPMAAELCKVSLWLEALEPGRPLSFLDDRILVGNSLLGATPVLIADGVPDDAFKPLLGDDKDVVKAWRAHNARERKGQASMLLQTGEPSGDAATLTASAQALAAIDDSSPEGVFQRERAYRELTASAVHERLRLSADAWVASFVTPKEPGAPRVTTSVIRRAEADGAAGLAVEEQRAILAEVERYAPLHWHVAFPAVFRAGDSDVGEHGWAGGFDCVLGNPPWERVKLQEKEFFAGVAPEISAAKNKAARERMIVALAGENPGLHALFLAAKRRAEGESHLLRSTGRYPLCGRGDVNTYAVFAEGMRSLLSPGGRLGVIVPTGIVTDDTTRAYFEDLVAHRNLVSVLSFENEGFVFPAVHHETKFCLLTASSEQLIDDPDFFFFARSVSDLADESRRFSLSPVDIALLNPNSKTCPIFRTGMDAEITKAIYRRVPILVRDGDPDGNPWGIRFATMFHMSADSDEFRTREQLEDSGWHLDGNQFRRAGKRMVPLYEGKMFWQFDHRYGTYDGQSEAQARQGTLPPTDETRHRDPDYVIAPRYWVSGDSVHAAAETKGTGTWLCAFRDITRMVNERTAIFSALPLVGVGHVAPLVMLDGQTPARRLAFIALANSFVFDYVCRQKIGGGHLTYFVLKQVAIPTPESLERRPQWLNGQSYQEFIVERALELVYTSHDLDAVAREMSIPTQPYRWDGERREVLRAELDAAIFDLYGLTVDDAEHILGTFSVARQYELAKYEEARSERLILEFLSGAQQTVASSARGQRTRDSQRAQNSLETTLD